MIDTQSSTVVGAKKVLVIEDDEDIARVLEEFLQGSNYQVWVAHTGAEGERLLNEVHPDLVLLDLVLPDTDGLIFCAQLRPRWNIPVILISATQRQRDRVLGLKLGADDFIAKPFDLDELLARVEAVLRRSVTTTAAPRESARTTQQPQALGAFSIDRARRVAAVSGRALDLTPTEFQIVGLMTTRPGEVFTRQELASALWGQVDVSKSRAIDVHIRRLRQKLEGVPQAPVIATVWGYGYKLDPDA